jgi:hypothetical protein
MVMRQVLMGLLVAVVCLASGCFDEAWKAQWPPTPASPARVGKEHVGWGCRVTDIVAGINQGARLTFRTDGASVRSFQSAWPKSHLRLRAESPRGSFEEFETLPYVSNQSTSKPTLNYVLSSPQDTNDGRFDDVVIHAPAYARWYPWAVSGVVKSTEPGLDGLGLLTANRTVERGWVLISGGNEHDDKVFFSDERGALHEDRYQVPLQGSEAVWLDDEIVCPS